MVRLGFDRISCSGMVDDSDARWGARGLVGKAAFQTPTSNLKP